MSIHAISGNVRARGYQQINTVSSAVGLTVPADDEPTRE
jgi:hypothetical protein